MSVTNTGTAPLIISSIRLGGTNPSQFAQSGCGPFPATLNPGANCTINVTFTPTAAAPLTKTATLSVNVAAPATSVSVSLTGNIIVPTFTVTGGPLAFGNQGVGTTSTAQLVTVTNTGTVAALIITNITLGGTNPGQFAFTNVNCPIGGAGLAAGLPCTINVTFHPTSVGPKGPAQLDVHVGAPATPSNTLVSLSGTGI